MHKEIKGQVKVSSKKANFLFNIVKKYSAGLMLTGTEVKSIRMSRVSINEAFCYFKKNELFVKNMNIGEYESGTYHNHLPNRERKLLLRKSEINQLQTKVKEKGLTIIPIVLYINERGYVKLDIALAQGKKVFDKRNTIKDRDNKRDMDRLKKKFRMR